MRPLVIVPEPDILRLHAARRFKKIILGTSKMVIIFESTKENDTYFRIAIPDTVTLSTESLLTTSISEEVVIFKLIIPLAPIDDS